MTPQAQRIDTTVCIVGGGPCGIVLGVLLARAGIDVVVLEKYPDFFRDFRGDTIHPSTLQLLVELGWIDDFLKLPHDELKTFDASVDGELLHVADFSRLPVQCKFIAFMPQWDFLDFFAGRGRAYPGFHLLMQTEGVDCIEEDGRITGVRARGPSGELEIRAKLVAGTDGRHSTVRARCSFEVENLGAPMDVLWMRVEKRPGDPEIALGTVRDGHFLVCIDRRTYWQCAYLIAKGSFERVKAEGLPALHDALDKTAPALAGRFDAIDDWAKISLLEVRVDRLKRWHAPGVLCIGDAAHAMSPIGGVGINLAIQDAVATANALYPALAAGKVPSETELARVQARRTFPTVVTQGFQVFAQNHAVDPILAGQTVRAPLAFRLFDTFPGLRALPGRLLGLGVRPEHVQTPDAFRNRGPT